MIVCAILLLKIILTMQTFSDMFLDGELATVTGWGRNEHGRLETKLQKLTAEIYPNSLCDDRWNVNGAPSGFIAPTMLCMSASDGDSCNVCTYSYF